MYVATVCKPLVGQWVAVLTMNLYEETKWTYSAVPAVFIRKGVTGNLNAQDLG